MPSIGLRVHADHPGWGRNSLDQRILVALGKGVGIATLREKSQAIAEVSAHVANTTAWGSGCRAG